MRPHGSAKAFRETRLTTATKVAWIAAGSKFVQKNEPVPVKK